MAVKERATRVREAMAMRVNENINSIKLNPPTRRREWIIDKPSMPFS